MCVSPHRDDFITYSEESGRVLQGLTKGVTVKGVGVVKWTVEIGNKVVELRLRALHVPQSDVRLLSPQQLKREHSSTITKMDIGDDSLTMLFPEGVLSCPYNESNLPVMKLSTPSTNDDKVKALHACVMAENNQNLTVSQKELLKWHCKLGHVNFKQVQSIMRSGALLTEATSCLWLLCLCQGKKEVLKT